MIPPRGKTEWAWNQIKTFNLANAALLITVIVVASNIQTTLNRQQTANDQAQLTLNQLNTALISAQDKTVSIEQAALALNSFNVTLAWAISNGLPNLVILASNFSQYAGQTNALISSTAILASNFTHYAGQTNALMAAAVTNVSVVQYTLPGVQSYTAPSNLVYAVVEVVGGGGGGSSAAATSAGQTVVGGGGGGGGYSRRTWMHSELAGLGPLSVVVGIGGAADAAGGASSFHSVHSASGGQPGVSGGASPNAYGFGGAGGQGSGGDIVVQGSSGGVAKGASIYGFTGTGGASALGAQRSGEIVNGGTSPGSPGVLYGGGGSGAGTANTAAAGGAGATGVVIITQYLHLN